MPAAKCKPPRFRLQVCRRHVRLAGMVKKASHSHPASRSHRRSEVRRVRARTESAMHAARQSGSTDLDERETTALLASRLREQRKALAEVQCELEESRQASVDLYDFAPVGHLDLDPRGCIRTINLTGARLLGQERAALIRRPLLPFVAQPDRRAFLAHLHRLRRGEAKVTSVLRLAPKGQPIVPIQVISAAVPGSNPEPSFQTALVDLTERHRAEQIARASEQGFRSLFENSIEAMFQADTSGRFTDANRAGERLSGYTKAELLRMTFHELVAPDKLEAAVAAFQAGLRGQPPTFETAILTKDRRRRELFVTTTVMMAEAGQVVGLFAIAQDVTERKQAQETLRVAQHALERRVRKRTAELTRANAALQAEFAAHRQAQADRARLATIVESSADAIVSQTLAGIVMSWNKGAERLFGYAAREIIGRSFWPLIPSNRRAETRKLMNQIRRGKAVEAIETVRLREDGSLVQVALTLSPIKDEAGRVEAVAAIEHDITNRKRVEQALHASEARFRGFLESAPDAVVITDQTGQIVLVNSEAERLFGYRRQELLGQRVERLVPKRYHRQHRTHRGRYMGRPQRRPMGIGLELFGRRKDGSEVPVEISLSPLHTPEGTFVSSVVRDVTERRQAEKALRESEARLQTILDHSPALIFLKDPQGRYLHFNRAFERTFHLPLNEGVGKTDAELFPPDQAAAFRGHDVEVIGARAPLTFDEVALHDDGPHTSVVTKFPLLNQDGEVYAIGGIATDITERRRLQVEVAEVGERERQRIGQDLHDGLCQLLTAIRLKADALQQDLAKDSRGGAQAAQDMGRLLGEAINQAHGLARGLQLVAAVPEGLMLALRRLAESARALFGIACRCEIPGRVLVADNSVATDLFRIAQEAVHNAVKHARSRRVRIRLARRGEHLMLRVTNDGRPFVARPRTRGLGLQIMQYRAARSGGTLNIRPGLRQGAVVECCLELDQSGGVVRPGRDAMGAAHEH